ncbi:MAG: adenylate/guanylate cyclase domain-containing protein [Tabrizicola sp.]|nr:adenylate/guanylate cyclase domain-containing protein [Tabrizicola sp.]
MTETRDQRRLAAILAADVVGYSRLVGLDEGGTLAALRGRWRDVLTPAVTRHSGRVVKVMGDGVLVEFGSAVDAVECALALQAGFAAANGGAAEDRHILLRIGVNLGDIVVQGNDIFGEGVNIAARLEGLAEPGGICVSAKVHAEVQGKLVCTFEAMGPQALKNIAGPVQVYRVYPKVEAQLPVLPEKPSIAVLPFTSMSADADHAYFVDGLTEDLITDLSRNPDLFVIARNSTFAYKGRSVDVRQIARELGVRYLLEGSARRSGGRVRINAQLIDAIGGGHLWAERFDSEMQDIFDLQDAVTTRIVRELSGRLAKVPSRRRTTSIEAYDFCVRGRALITNGGGKPAVLLAAVGMMERALALDPTYAEAHRWIAFCRLLCWVHNMEPEGPHRVTAVEHARKAVEFDPLDAANQWVLAWVLSYEHLIPETEAAFARSLAMDPSSADAWATFADISAVLGRTGVALDAIRRAIRLEPHTPFFYYWFEGFILYCDRQYEAAARSVQRAEVFGTASHRILAAALAQLGRVDEARQEAAFYMAATPGFRIGRWLTLHAYGDRETLDHYADGCRKAGLPE